ncbi:uncharacterized protein LOC135086420 [Ostrinia nubilalis]|uniref:uncharacterized protein LOC135086420 n=1 Tax=Ostrinia nubilalis TaxID=29057 RepID=UPI0030825AE0
MYTEERKGAWRCVECMSNLPKIDNTNTPVRGFHGGITYHRGAATGSPIELNISTAENLNDTAHNQTLDLTDRQAILLELRAFREEMLTEIRTNRAQIEQLNEKVTALTGRVSECENRIDQLEVRMNTLESGRTEGLEKELDKSVLTSIENIKAELNDRDQDLLLNDLEISCVPEVKGESLSHVIMTLASKLGVGLGQQDIVSVDRVGRVLEAAAEPAAPRRPRHIVVRLSRRAVRDQLLQAARVRRGATTEGLGLPEPSRRFYVNERLTKLNRALFRRTRDLANQLNWRYVWTRDGRIYARQYPTRDSPRLRVRSESDLVRVFGEAAVGSTNN